MAKLSVVISAYNEEAKLPACLESVAWAEEIIVVDNSSTDKTAEIAKKYATRVISQKNDPEHIDLQKNTGFTAASHEWILSLDADERIPSELKSEIQAVLEKDDQLVAGYFLPRKNMIFGKWIEHTGWYPDYQLRLFRKNKGQFSSDTVHQMLHVEGKTEKLASPLLHLNYETIPQFLQKMLVYVPSEAKAIQEKGYHFDARDVIRFPAKEFLSRYFAREGYKDGLHGLVLSLLMAVYHFLIFCYLWQESDFQEVSQENLQQQLEPELKSTAKELEYWSLTARIQQSHGVKKNALKALRKTKKYL